MSKEKLSEQQVLHIAQLCNLKLSPQEIKKLANMLADTIDYIDVLEELDTEDMPETYQVTGLKNVYQKEGEAETTLTQEEALKNAKEVINEMIATKAVFER